MIAVTLFFLLAAAGPAAKAASIAEDAAPLSDTCTQAGGTPSLEGSLFQCCWPKWGCLSCAVIGDGGEPFCFMNCATQECENANALSPDDPKISPRAKNPDAFDGLITPGKNPQTKKPITADPAPATVQ